MSLKSVLVSMPTVRSPIGALQLRSRAVVARSHKVTLNFEGKSHVLEVPSDGTTILDVALEQGIPVSHDCKMGVCMTCPAKLVKGNVDQGAGMLSDDVIAKGYALLCTSTPTSDCEINCITEEEILSQQLQTAND